MVCVRSACRHVINTYAVAWDDHATGHCLVGRRVLMAGCMHKDCISWYVCGRLDDLQDPMGRLQQTVEISAIAGML